MAKYKVKRSHCLGGGVDVYEGEVIELDAKSAGYRVGLGWLVPVTGAEPDAAPAPDPATAVAAEPTPALEPEPAADESQPSEPEPAGEPGDAPASPEYSERPSGAKKSKSR